MAINLETLILTYDADFSSFESQLDKAISKAESKAKKLQNLKITPKVDLSQLHELNDLLDVKQKHLKETIDYFKDNVIEPQSDGGSASSSGSNSFNNEFQKAHKEQTKNLHKNTKEFFNFVTAPFESALTGVFEGLGNNVAKEMSKGLNKSLQENLDIDLSSIGAGIGDIVAETGKRINKTFDLKINEKPEPPKEEETRQRRTRKRKSKSNPEDTDSGSGGALARIDLSDTFRTSEKIVVNTQKALQTVDRTVASIYKVAKGVENGVLGNIPGGKAAKSVLKHTALPIGTAIAASQLPGGHALLEAAQGAVNMGVSPIVNSLGGAVSGNISSALSSTLGELPFVGNQVAGALSEAVSTIVSGATGGAIEAVSGVGGAIVAGKSVQNAAKIAKNTLVGNKPEDLKALPPSNTEIIAEETTRKAIAQAQATANYFSKVAKEFNASSKKLTQVTKLIAAAEEGKQLSGADIKMIAATVQEGRKYAENVVNAYQTAQENFNQQAQALPKEQRKGLQNPFIQAKAKVTRVKNQAQDFLAKTDRFVRNPKNEIENQIYGAINVKSERIADDTVEGLNKGINVKDAYKKGKDIGDALQKGTKDSLGIKSPARVFIAIGLDILRGLKGGLQGLGTILKDVQAKIFKSTKSISNEIKELPKPDLKSGGLNSVLPKLPSLKDLHGNPLLPELPEIKTPNNRKEARNKRKSDSQDLKKALDNFGKSKNSDDLGKIYQAELEKLLKERAESLKLDKAIKDPKAFIKRLMRRSHSDARIEWLSQAVAEEGSQKALDGMFRSFGKSFKNKVFKGEKPTDRAGFAGEAVGMVASAATMYNPVLPAMAALSPLMLPLAPIGAALFGLSNLLTPLLDKVRTALESSEPVTKRIDSVAGSEQAGSEMREFVGGISEKYGINIEQALQNFSQLQVASRRTKLEGDGVKKLFEGIAVSIKALRLPAYDAGLVFNAYTQILSKGKLSMEELRQQLGEKFPPAMDTFAQALGVTIPELNKLVSQGAVLGDEVLNNVGDVLIKNFGEAAKSSSLDFLSSVTRVENATFKLNQELSKQFGALFAFFNNGVANITGFVADNMAMISKIVGAALIGITAQVGVGLSAIMQTPAIAGKVATIQNTILSGFKAGLVTLTPFLVGIAVDFFDDFLGAKNSVFQNMAQGVSNVFISAFAAVDNTLRGAGTALFGSLANKDKGLDEEPKGKGVLGAVGSFFKILPSGLVEMGALLVMFEQIMVLGKILLKNTLENLWISLKGMGSAFKAAATSGQTFSATLKTLLADSMASQAGMKLLALATKAFLAVAVIAFARSDFSDPLLTSIQKAESGITNSLRSINKELKNLNTTITEVTNNLGNIKLPSKGLELNPMVWLGMSESSFKTDDLLNSMNSNAVGRLFTRARTYEDVKYQIKAEELGVNKILPLDKGGQQTLAQRQVINEAQDLTAQGEQIFNNLSTLELAPHNREGFFKGDIEKSYKDLEALDKQLGELGAKRFKLTLEGTPEAKKQIIEINEEFRKLFLDRQEKSKPISNIIDEIDTAKKNIDDQYAAIENDNKPEVVKRFLRGILDPQKKLIDDTIAYLESKGLRSILKPLEDSWEGVVGKLKDTEAGITSLQQKTKIKESTRRSKLYSSFDNAYDMGIEQDRLSIVSQVADTERLSNLVNSRKEALEKLLAMDQVESNPERQEEIKSLRESLIQSEQELATARESLAKTRFEIVAKERTRLLNDAIVRPQINLLKDSNISSQNRAEKENLSKFQTNNTLAGLFYSLGNLRVEINSGGRSLNQMVGMLNLTRDSLSKNFGEDTKKWFLTLLDRPTEDFADVIDDLNSEILSKIQQGYGDQIEGSPERKALFQELQSYASLSSSSKDLKSEQVQKQNAFGLQVKQVVKQINDQFYQLSSSLYENTQAYTQFVTGIKDSTYDLVTSTQELARSLVKTGRDMKSDLISSLSTRLDAAGLEDILGLNKIRNLAVKGISITQSDRRPEIETEIKTQTRDYEKQKRNDELSLYRLNQDTSKAIFELQNQRETVSPLDKSMLPESIDLGQLTGMFNQLQTTVNKINQSVEQSNLDAQAVGSNQRLAGIDVKIPQISDFTNPEDIFAFLQDSYKMVDETIVKAISQYESIRAQGNADYAQARKESEDAFKAKMEAQREVLRVEGERVAQANRLLVEEIGATIFSISQNLKQQLSNFSKNAIEMKSSISSLFTGSGIVISTEDMLDNVISSKIQEIDSKILEMELAGEKLKEYLKVENPQELTKLIQDSDLDKSVKSQLLSDLNKVTNANDFKEVIERMRQLGYTYAELTNTLKENKDDIIKGTQDIFLREGNRKIEDAQELLKQEMAQSGGLFKTDKQKALIQIDLDEQKAKVDLQRQLEDLALSGNYTPEQLKELATTLEQVNSIKFDRLRREASDTYKVLTSMQSGLESAFTNIFTNIGDSLFKGADRDKAIMEINADYGSQLKEVEDKFGDDSEQLAKAKDRLEVLNESKLDKVRNEFSLLGNVLGTVKNAFIDFAKMMLETIAKIAAQKLAVSIIGAVAGGALGSAGSNAFTNASSYSFGQAGTFGGGFALGGEIGEGSVINPLSDTIRQTMVKEGNKATLIVASKGEQILSERTGDAQFYRALQKSGQWREMRSQGINNYSLGGSVGNTTSVPMGGGKRPSNIRTTNVTNTYNLNVKDTNTMRRTQQQLMAEAELRAKRASDRNR